MLRREVPVVCIDEMPLGLHRGTRAPLFPQTERLARRDYEYDHCGTAGGFCEVQTKAERHFRKAMHTRSAEFADYRLEIFADYAQVRTIRLFAGNLNTKGRRAFTKVYSEKVDRPESRVRCDVHTMRAV